MSSQALALKRALLPFVNTVLNGLVSEHRSKQLANSGGEHGTRLAGVIASMKARGSGETAQIIASIEGERARMLTLGGDLVDGSLGESSAIDAGKSIKQAVAVSKPKNGAALLYSLVREFKPTNAIELGTNVGISAAYQATALNERGTLTTFDVSPYRVRLARQLHAALNISNIRYEIGLFDETLPTALQTLDPVDYAYIDGNHRYQPTIDYFNLIWRHTAEDALFVFDDIRWSGEMKLAWQRIATDPRVALAVNFHSMGVCFTKRSAPLSNFYFSQAVLRV